MKETSQQACGNAVALADCAALLAICLRYPTDELVEGYVDGSLWSDFEECLNELGLDFDTEAKAWQAPASALNDCMHELREDYTCLFIAPRDKVIPMYESEFRNSKKENPDDILLFVNDCAMHVEQTMRKAHVSVDRRRGEPEDHIAIEFEFLRHLYLEIARCLHAGDPGKAGEYQELVDGFWRIHLRKWCPNFFEEMLARAKTPFYKGVSLLGQAFVSNASEACARKLK